MVSPGEAALVEERKRLRAALDAAQLGTWRHDVRAGVVVLDARGQQHYGLTRAEMPMASLDALVHPDDRARLMAELAVHLGPAGPGLFTTEYRVVHPDGSSHDLVVHVRIEFEGDGPGRRPLFGYGTTQDVTDARAATRRLHDQALLLREVGEIAKVGGWEFDPTTGAGSWTEETYRIHGLDGQPQLASSGLERFEGEARARIEAGLHEAVTHGTPYDYELPFTSLTGERKWVRAACRPIVEGGRVVRLRGTLQDITERRQSELALSRFVQASPVLIYALAVEADGPRLVWTGGDLTRFTGWTPADAAVPDWWLSHLHPDDRARVEATNAEILETGHLAVEFRFRRPDGEYFWVRDERRLLRDADGRPTEVVGSWSNITARIGLESQLRQAQKLEAIGQLAGGVAHDFNNVLTIIMGNCELLGDLLAGQPDGTGLLDEIRHASERASALTRQLLAFSRKQTLQPAVIRVNTAIERLERMLGRLIGEDIAVELRLDPAAGHILVDPGQLEQVVLNLAVNARDAMPHGGRLTISTESVEASALPGPPPVEAAADGFLRLTIADTGTGMTPEVQQHIFEPFFTTKPAGRGTGLGLATVFGIVNQSGGAIAVHSAPGAGTRFEIDFPRTAAAPGKGAAPLPGARGCETVLLVEDDADVRRVASLVLARHGYRVIEADSPARAVELAAGEPVALLLTDVVMPGMSGSALAAAVRAVAPSVRVLFTSGYVQDALERQGLSDGREALLSKPFTVADLTRRVREVLDGEA